MLARKNMRELISQMGAIHSSVADLLADPASAILDIDRKVAEAIRSDAFLRKFPQHPAGRFSDSMDRCAG